jgi:hypothetical protein
MRTKVFSRKPATCRSARISDQSGELKRYFHVEGLSVASLHRPDSEWRSVGSLINPTAVAKFSIPTSSPRNRGGPQTRARPIRKSKMRSRLNIGKREWGRVLKVRCQRSENRGQKWRSEISDSFSGDAAVRSQKSEVRDQRSDSEGKIIVALLGRRATGE